MFRGIGTRPKTSVSTFVHLNGRSPGFEERGVSREAGRHGSRLLVRGFSVCNKLQLDDRITLGCNGVAPDRSWDKGPSYA